MPRRTHQAQATPAGSLVRAVLPTNCRHMRVGPIRLDGPHTWCSAPVSPYIEEVSSEVLEVNAWPR